MFWGWTLFDSTQKSFKVLLFWAPLLYATLTLRAACEYDVMYILETCKSDLD